MRCWVEVSLGAIRANFLAVQNVVGPGVEVMPVVKADAYRHGAVEVSRALEAQGAPTEKDSEHAIIPRQSPLSKESEDTILGGCMNHDSIPLPIHRDSLIQTDNGIL